jgi:AmiR/NasT family two-component response regulator
MPLTAGTRRVGSLNIYQRHPRHWSDEDVHAVRSMADIATAYIVRAGELVQARVLAGQLEHALGSRVVIEQAKGVLSRDHGVSVDAAFDLLRSYSRRERRSLREVAHDVVHTGLRID